jgi:hypothetical protein
MRIESSAAMGPGPATMAPWLSGVSETVKPPAVLPVVAFRRTAPLSIRPEPLISMGVKSHYDIPPSPIMVKKSLRFEGSAQAR